MYTNKIYICTREFCERLGKVLCCFAAIITITITNTTTATTTIIIIIIILAAKKSAHCTRGSISLFRPPYPLPYHLFDFDIWSSIDYYSTTIAFIIIIIIFSYSAYVHTNITCIRYGYTNALRAKLLFSYCKYVYIYMYIFIREIYILPSIEVLFHSKIT